MPEHQEAQTGLGLCTTDLLDRDTFSQTFTNLVFFWYRRGKKEKKKKDKSLRQSFLFSSLKKGKTRRMCHHNVSPYCFANLSGHI